MTNLEGRVSQLEVRQRELETDIAESEDRQMLALAELKAELKADIKERFDTVDIKLRVLAITVGGLVVMVAPSGDERRKLLNNLVKAFDLEGTLFEAAP